MTCTDYDRLLVKPNKTIAEFAAVVAHARDCEDCGFVLMILAAVKARGLGAMELADLAIDSERRLAEVRSDPESGL